MINVLQIGDSANEIEKLHTFLDVWNNESSIISQKTSGSTGSPKTIEIPKWKMEASAKMTGEFLELDKCKSALLCISIDYIGGKMLVVRALTYNLNLYVCSVDSNPLKNINHSIDFVSMAPIQLEETIKQNPEKLNLIKHLIIGGAPVSESLISEIQKFSCNVYSTFGMTETISHIALKSLKQLNSSFQAIGKTTFTTEDDCLTIHSPELGIENLKTNDIVRLINSTSFQWLGRSDFVINSGGIKISPEIVEQKLHQLLPPESFIISYLSDAKLGQKVIFIGEERINKVNLQEQIDILVDKYERPKAYFFLPSLIKTDSGKIDRNKTTQAIR
ncbi:MAG: AMP-binding protein [Brumimicrobium sp.]|nr:AMP-binding protein [Brumimicrobium sp.]